MTPKLTQKALDLVHKYEYKRRMERDMGISIFAKTPPQYKDPKRRIIKSYSEEDEQHHLSREGFNGTQKEYFGESKAYERKTDHRLRPQD